MKERLLFASNIGLFALAVLVLGTLQTSLWFQIFGYFPSPALWLPVLIYVSLHRSTLEAVIFAYLTAFILSTMTAMPEGVLMVVCLALAVSIQLFKERIYWSTAGYFMMTAGLASLMFHVFHWSLSYLLGDQPLSSPQVMDWLIEALLTPLVAPLFPPIFRWFDQITGRETAPEASAQVT
jgi:cell shape-determining protein MreD